MQCLSYGSKIRKAAVTENCAMHIVNFRIFDIIYILKVRELWYCCWTMLFFDKHFYVKRKNSTYTIADLSAFTQCALWLNDAEYTCRKNL